jgi:hypothetical protein
MEGGQLRHPAAARDMVVCENFLPRELSLSLVFERRQQRCGGLLRHSTRSESTTTPPHRTPLPVCTSRRASCSHASDGKNRNTHAPCGPLKHRESERRSILSLRRRVMDRPQHHKISPLLFGRQRAFDGMHGGPQQLRSLEQTSYHYCGQTTLSQMHSMSRQGEGQIDTVIDEQPCLPAVRVATAPLMTRSSRIGEITFTQLHRARTGTRSPARAPTIADVRLSDDDQSRDTDGNRRQGIQGKHSGC